MTKRARDLCLSVALTSCAEVSISVPGEAIIRELKQAVREALQQDCPLWQLEIWAAGRLCDESCFVTEYVAAMSLVVQCPGPDEYPRFYGQHVRLSGDTACLPQLFFNLSDTRKVDILETLAVDERVHLTVERFNTHRPLFTHSPPLQQIRRYVIRRLLHFFFQQDQVPG